MQVSKYYHIDIAVTDSSIYTICAYIVEYEHMPCQKQGRGGEGQGVYHQRGDVFSYDFTTWPAVVAIAGR